MKGRALAKNKVKHDIFDHLSVVQIFLAGSFVAIRLTCCLQQFPEITDSPSSSDWALSQLSLSKY